MLRAMIVGVVFGALATLVPACGPTEKCGPTTCASGCCSADGKCQPGFLETGCGVAGGQCAVCAGNEHCNSGTCAASILPKAGPAVGEFCGVATVSICKYMVRCGMYQAQASCEFQFGQQADCANDELAGVKDGRIEYSPAKAKACLAYIDTQASCADFDFEGNADCAATFAGKVALGGNCYDSVDCISTGFCKASVTSCPGTCQARKAEGEQVGYEDECLAGLYQYDGALDRTCRALVAAGASCFPVAGGSYPQECVVGHFCDSGTCQPLRTVGATCDDQSMCAFNLRCTGGTCQPMSSVGGACSFQSGGARCKGDLSCAIPSGSTAGTCQLPVDVGSSCNFRSDCKPGLYCSGATYSPPTPGTCAAQVGAGSVCTDHDACSDGLYCESTSGTCAARKAAGASCSESFECTNPYQCDYTAKVCAPSHCFDPTP